MNKEDYEKYYQKGGSYIIPVEIFNELLDDYECFKNDCKKYKEVIDKIKDKFNLYKNTDWGLKSCEILKVFEDILNEVE